jgi:hypothetical protein
MPKKIKKGDICLLDKSDYKYSKFRFVVIKIADIKGYKVEYDCLTDSDYPKKMSWCMVDSPEYNSISVLKDIELAMILYG